MVKLRILNNRLISDIFLTSADITLFSPYAKYHCCYYIYAP